jgi:hypothetical protein
MGQGMAELEAISKRNRRALEEHEQEFQTHQDWPGTGPMKPERVLETQ